MRLIASNKESFGLDGYLRKIDEENLILIIVLQTNLFRSIFFSVKNSTLYKTFSTLVNREYEFLDDLHNP